MQHMTHKDFYEILGIDEHAGPHEIKDAYRKLAFQYHPDRNGDDPTAAEKMKEINESYAVLADPVKRREYDALRRQFGPSAYGQFRQAYSERDIFKGSDINQIFEEMGKAFGFRGFEEVFREFYGPGYRTFQFRKPGFSGRGFMFVSPSGIGRDYFQSFPGGRLLKYGLKKIWGIESPQRGKDWNDLIHLPPWQAQQGGKIRYFHRRRAKELMVHIPPGIRDGQVIRLHGMGDDGKGGAEAGDLYLRVRVDTPFVEKMRDLAQHARSWIKKVSQRQG